MKKSLLISFVIIVLIQLSMLGARIYKYENILKNGKVFYLKPKPVDPRDLLKGRYVMLNFGKQSVKCDNKAFEKIRHDSHFYVQIKQDENLTFENAQLEKPDSGDFLKVRSGSKCINKNVSFYFIFDRFYMNEHKAKKLETTYNNLIDKNKVLAKVRVYEGIGVIEDLTIDSISASKYDDKKK